MAVPAGVGDGRTTESAGGRRATQRRTRDLLHDEENDEVKGPRLVDAMTPGREGRKVVVEAVTLGVGTEAVRGRHIWRHIKR